MESKHITILAVLVCAIIGTGGCGKREDTSARDLKTMVVVPTLDSPMPTGRNVVWCSSFQLAWNKLKKDVIGEPIEIEGAEEVANRLNSAAQSSLDVPKGSYYADAGLVKNGILRQIQQEMDKSFPSEPKPQFDKLPPESIVAYSYLLANVKFTIPYFENRDSLTFTDSKGKPTQVSSFGIRSEDDYAYDRLRQQVEVLYRWRDPEKMMMMGPHEYAVDLCKTSNPTQIVIAVIQPQATLALTFASLEKKCSDFSKNERHFRSFGPNDVLLVPNMLWKVVHHFKELEGKSFKNKGFDGYPVAEASQMIQFKLDRSGADLKSEAKFVALGGGASRYIFNKPFLIYMKKRGAEHPFFVMWVDNAEPLSKF